MRAITSTLFGLLFAATVFAADSQPVYQIHVSFEELSGDAILCTTTVTDVATKEVVFAPRINFQRKLTAGADTTREDGEKWKVDVEVTENNLGRAMITHSREGRAEKQYRAQTTIKKLSQ